MRMDTPAINPKYALFNHVYLPLERFEDKGFQMRGQIKESRYNPRIRENVYMIEVYSHQECKHSMTIFVPCDKKIVIRRESEILKRG